MLDGLDQVQWDKVRHAYGRATDVPKQLRALASDDATVRATAWDGPYGLYGNLWHQGTIYEATAYAVPFLVELAESPQVADRHKVLDYLGALARGNSYWDVHQHLAISRAERNKPDFNARLAQELAWVRAAREAVRAGAPSYARLLTDPAPLVRAGAAYLLGHFGEDAERNIAWIRAHISASHEEVMVRAASVLSIGLLATAHAEATGWLEQVLAEDGSQGVRVAAALGLAWGMRSAIPEVARTLLIETAAAPREAQEVFEQFPWGADVQVYASDALAIIGGEPEQSLAALITSLNDVAFYQSWDVARSMLHLVFAGRPKPATATVTDLTSDQRAALFAIAQSKNFWTGFGKKRFVVNAMDVLGSFGLPETPEELSAFLDGRTVTDDPYPKRLSLKLLKR